MRRGRPSEEAGLSLGSGLHTLVADCVEGKILRYLPQYYICVRNLEQDGQLLGDESGLHCNNVFSCIK